MPRLFKNKDFQLLFPENWYLSESHQDTDGINYQITLEHPDGAFWLLSACHSEADGARLVAALQQEIADQYESVEWTESAGLIPGLPVRGQEGMFFSLDLLITAEVHAFTWREQVFVLLTQAENREFEQLRPVFQAIVASMLQSPPTPATPTDAVPAAPAPGPASETPAAGRKPGRARGDRI